MAEIKQSAQGCMNAEMIRFAWNAKQRGYSVKAISKELHVSERTIGKTFARCGLTGGWLRDLLPPLHYTGSFEPDRNESE